MSRLSILVVAVAACGDTSAAPADDVMVNLASVTLGDDCGGTLPAPAAPAKADTEAQEKRRAPAKGAPDADAISDDGEYRGPRGGCAQTSMQLSVTTHPQLKPTAVKIKKVELQDEKGKTLEVLTASKPSKWGGKAYVTWNESVGANEKLVTSYVLTTPNWGKLTGGRRNAHTKKFQLHVTLTIGGKDKTIDKKVTASAFIEPDVDT